MAETARGTARPYVEWIWKIIGRLKSGQSAISILFLRRPNLTESETVEWKMLYKILNTLISYMFIPGPWSSTQLVNYFLALKFIFDLILLWLPHTRTWLPFMITCTPISLPKWPTGQTLSSNPKSSCSLSLLQYPPRCKTGNQRQWHSFQWHHRLKLPEGYWW